MSIREGLDMSLTECMFDRDTVESVVRSVSENNDGRIVIMAVYDALVDHYGVTPYEISQGVKVLPRVEVPFEWENFLWSLVDGTLVDLVLAEKVEAVPGGGAFRYRLAFDPFDTRGMQNENRIGKAVKWAS